MPEIDTLKRPRLPVDTRIYAIGDIHGCSNLLEEAFAIIDADMVGIAPARCVQVFLGDYIDRGPDSRRTLDLLISRSLRHETVFLKGNHEALLLDVLRNPEAIQNWIQFGGLNTLMSYGLRPSLKPNREEQIELAKTFASEFPKDHFHFMGQLKPAFWCGDFFFVHAGLRPGVPLDQQTEEDMLWIRDPFLQSDEGFEKFIVHGHTPVREADIRQHRINIDTGSYATGKLTVLKIQHETLSIA